jgi:hypothetical protein
MESAISQHDAKLWSLFIQMMLYFLPGDLWCKEERDWMRILKSIPGSGPFVEKLGIRNDRIDNLGMYMIELRTR